jgi:hypothetical protein
VFGLGSALEIFLQWQRYVVGTVWWHHLRPYSHFGGWMYLMPLLIPLGLGIMIVGLGPFRLRIDERGVTVNNWLASVRMALPWEHVAAIALRGKPGDRADAEPYLMLWPVAGANVDAKESYVLDDRTAYAIVQVDDIREPMAELVAALRQYAGPRFIQTQGPQQPPTQYPGPQHPGPRYPGPQYPGPPQQPPQYPGPPYPSPGQR